MILFDVFFLLYVFSQECSFVKDGNVLVIFTLTFLALFCPDRLAEISKTEEENQFGY